MLLKIKMFVVKKTNASIYEKSISTYNNDYTLKIKKLIASVVHKLKVILQWKKF